MISRVKSSSGLCAIAPSGIAIGEVAERAPEIAAAVADQTTIERGGAGDFGGSEGGRAHRGRDRAIVAIRRNRGDQIEAVARGEPLRIASIETRASTFAVRLTGD